MIIWLGVLSSVFSLLRRCYCLLFHFIELVFSHLDRMLGRHFANANIVLKKKNDMFKLGQLLNWHCTLTIKRCVTTLMRHSFTSLDNSLFGVTLLVLLSFLLRIIAIGVLLQNSSSMLHIHIG